MKTTVIIERNDNAFIQLENGNTLRKMNIANRTSVYMMNEGDDFAATTIYELAGSMPVNFKAVEDGEYTIIVNGEGELKVYDVLGRLVLQKHVNGVETYGRTSLQTGVYIFMMNGNAQKIVVR